MLVSPSTLLARARRHKQVALLCNVSNLDTLQPVTAVTTAKRKPVIITLDAQFGSGLSAEMALRIACELCDKAPQPISIGIVIEPVPEHVDHAVQSGVSFVQPLLSSQHGHEEVMAVTTAIADQARPNQLEIIGHVPGGHMGNTAVELASSSGVQAIVYSVESEPQVISPSYLHDLAKRCRVPLILEASHISHQWASLCQRSGIGGWSPGTGLSEAYTAGVRTSLRNRALINPATYQASGTLAVAKTLEHYLELLY